MRFVEPTWGLGLITCVFALGCANESSGDGGGTEGDSGVTASVGDDETSADGSTSGDGATADGTGGSCPDEQVCGDVCCEAGELCEDGMCRVDCGGDPPCGEEQQCCGGDEICYAGQCVTPGASCSAAACATKVGSDCGEDEICDAELGQCVPNFADPTCAFEPEVGVFDPVPRFTWGVRQERSCDLGCQKAEVCNAGNLCEPTWNHVTIAQDDFPEFHQVVMSPMVADLDNDCIPEIIFNSYQPDVPTPGRYIEDGILRAIRGDNGAKLWTLGDENHRTDPGGIPAIGDLNGDGNLEVIVPAETQNLIAVDGATGTPLWTSEPYGFGGKSGSPSLANFDNTGDAEIAFGRAIYDSAGQIVFQAPSGATGSNGGVGPLSCVADLDADGRPELIAGSTVYRFTGTVGVDFAGEEAYSGTPADGFCGIADLDLDGAPEIVTVDSGSINVFNGQTGGLLADFAIPLGGAGGPPNIADFDGNGVPDIGTAGGDRYVVVSYADEALSLLWEADTKDGSSQRTGSSVFDFEGDGRSEVIYADEWYLRIYPGTEPACESGGGTCDFDMSDDEVLFQEINSSRTRSEYPIVVDVDGDFKAEIVVSTNNESGQGDIGDAGIEVFEDRLDNWVGTLPIWNQHSYHVTNVRADGSIPETEPPNWSTPAANPYNSYRRNTQGEQESQCAPDLVPKDLSVDMQACPVLEASVKVVNQGCLGVGSGVNVAFYDEQEGLLGVVQTQVAIPAGGATTVTFQLPEPLNPPYDLYVTVDDPGDGMGVLNECREENNSTEPAPFCQPVG